MPPVSQRDDLGESDRHRVEAVTAPTEDFTKPERFEAMAGGAATSRHAVTRDAFSHFSTNLSFEEEERFKLGNALFRKLWVSSPASTEASDGLGPLFNARSCQSCHLKDGRGHPPEGDVDATSMFLRLAVPPETDEQRLAIANKSLLLIPEPVYGTQLQDLAVPGIKAEGRMRIDYEEHPLKLADGTELSLRMPAYAVADPAYGPLHPGTQLSPRIANQMIGLGLVEQIHPFDILRQADPDDGDGDGISGKASIVRDAVTGKPALGRFGWKASVASIREQSGAAFAGDIGISNPIAPAHQGDCTAYERDCLAAPNGVQPALGDTEAPDPVLDLVEFYSQNLAVPARRDVGSAGVLAGKKLFYQIGCTGCHTPKYVTRRDAAQKGLGFQLIWPYSDFLLHDMGDGLADGMIAGEADGNEWRTPPLWGVGLTETVSGHSFFLHDGRARNLTEAILWHGGEAQASRDAFAALAAAERASLIAFLNSL
ncbi:MAG: di-heme oxidoredictase family protein [Rhizobiaceae bacterium]